MFAIYKRELKSFFQSMTGWLFVAAVIFLTGIYFFAINLLSGYSSVANTVAGASFIYILLIPLLSMRVLSEERKQKIDQLILTSPVSVGKIVVGKYLAMVTVLMIPILMVSIYPLILSLFGTVVFAENYIAILGFFLFGLAAVALGLFISSITESQVIAAIISFAAMFAVYMMSGIVSMLTSGENAVLDFAAVVLGAFDFTSRLDQLLNGQFDIRAVVYFLSVIAVFLFLTAQSIQKRRYSVSVKNFRLGAYSITSIIICIAAAVFANLCVNELPEKYTCFDLTQNRLYSLSAETGEYLQGIEEDIHIYVLQNEEDKDPVLDSTLKKMAALSDHITIEYKDPVKSPTFYKNYTDGNITFNSLIVESQKRYKVVDYSALYEYEIDYSTYSQSVTGYDGEGQIVSAIDYVTKEEMPVAYLITGHDELGMDTSFLEALEKRNFTVEELNLLKTEAIPEDAEFIMLLSPRSDYSKEDAQKVIEYIEKGGQLLVTSSLVENPAESLPNFQKILDCFQTTIVPGIIVEGNAQYYYGEPTYLLPDVMDSAFTEGVYGEKYAFVPYAQGITVTETDEITNTSILRSSADSYAKQGLDQNASYERAQTDQAGPFDIGVYVERTYGENAAGMFLFTSSNIFTDSANMMVANANMTIFNNCIEEFIDGEETSIVIPMKNFSQEALVISMGTAMLIGLTIILFVPVLLLILGFIIWYQRKKS